MYTYKEGSFSFISASKATKKAAAYATASFIRLSSVELFVLSCSSAIRTSNWFVFETLFLVEFLLTYGEYEFVVAVSANDLLVFHVFSSLATVFLGTSEAKAWNTKKSTVSKIFLPYGKFIISDNSHNVNGIK